MKLSPHVPRTVTLCASVLLLTFGLVATALAGNLLTLHPSGFGEHSYSAWKAKEGEADLSGNQFQALYFQKMTTTATFAAGVAVIKGLEGLPANSLTGLAWDHREDGHCGAGAPRWNVGITVGGMDQTVFFGCNAAQHTELGPMGPSGHGWCRDTQPSPAPTFPAGATIRYLAIVFDEGTDTADPPPAGCTQEQVTPSGFVFLDNITVTVNSVPHVWTSASDNGNGQTIMADPTGEAYVQSLIGAPVSTLFP
jgi:hypothetical protein